jgi:DNA-directed RNA polymerase subunit M/transcription elongation factor TFIIS
MPPARTKVNHPVLFLTQKGDVEQGTVLTTGELTIANIQAYFKKRQAIEPVGTFPYKELTLFIFGTVTGKEEQANKHQLPPPYDDTNFFGDIVIVASKEEDTFTTSVPFSPEDYEAFYTRAFGGIESDEEDQAVDDAEPVEELPAEEGKEFLNEEDDDDDEEEEEEEELAVEEEEAPVIAPKQKVKKRKAVVKASSTSILTGIASAYADRPLLSEAEQLQEQEGTEVPTTPIRLQILKGLRTLFGNLFSEENILKLEACIYNGSLKEARKNLILRAWNYPLFVHLYKMHARHIASNFNPSSYVENKELFERFQQGEVTFKDIAKMDTYELFPSRWKEQFEQQQIREKRQLEGNRSMATDMFLCSRCHKRECTYYEMQTRSADEPMTIFITCLNCGKHWRQ